MISFKPKTLFQNCHFQTIYPAIISFKNSLKITEKSILIPMPNGDQILTKCNINDKSNKVAFMIHGLEGSSEARYMVQTATRLFNEGFSTVRINLRNCGGTENLSQSLYNAGMSDDLEKVIDSFKNYQWSDIYLIGFSLGANLIGKYAGEKGEKLDPRIKKVILVSPPLDLNKTLLKISKGFNQFYNQHFTKLLKAKYKVKCQVHASIFDKRSLLGIKNLRDFDDKITGPYFGFKNALEYYEWGSSIKYIKNAKVPIYILQAEDDPIVEVSDHHDLSLNSGEFIKIIFTEKGGHVGFWGLGNGCKSAKYWLEESIFQLIHNN